MQANKSDKDTAMNKTMKKVVTELIEKATRFNMLADSKFYITKDEVNFGDEDTTEYMVEAYSKDLNVTLNVTILIDNHQ